MSGETYAEINPEGYAKMVAAARKNLVKRMEALPPLDVRELRCDGCLMGNHELHVDLLDGERACWCDDFICAGG